MKMADLMVVARPFGPRREVLKAATVLAAALVGWSSFAAAPALAQDGPVRVGIMAGEDEEVWKVVVDEAARQGLAVETVVFSDYTQPNEALAQGEIAANAFQHGPYLDAQVESQGYEISPAGYTALWPIGLYSKKYQSVAELPEGATIGVPNDPSNEGRALRLLQDQGLIMLAEDAGILATVTDVVENPGSVEITELDAGMVGRAVDDFDAAVVNTDWALKAGLDPQQDRIAQESVEGNPYRNIIVVRTAELEEPWVKSLVAAYQNETVRAAFDRVYRGAGIPAY